MNAPNHDLKNIPFWASNYGQDSYGSFADFTLLDVTQRLRWIPPGTFMMGSPESEPERYDDEGPRHQVTLTHGFWLFDTPCTQALWQALIGKNPSRFKGANHPVENVTWNDCQGFIKKLNEHIPGLNLELPSEAQWEYACRAGTTTPFSFGANITPEQVNYDGNYPYAGGQKGMYRQQTVPVASLPPNPWGLHEMQGNVLEWCQDTWHRNYQGAPQNGSAWENPEADANRVIRGGSWCGLARVVRAAYRNSLDHADRSGSLGFRCAHHRVFRGGALAAMGSGGSKNAPGFLGIAMHQTPEINETVGS